MNYGEIRYEVAERTLVDGLAHEFALFAELQSELRARPNDGGGTA